MAYSTKAGKKGAPKKGSPKRSSKLDRLKNDKAGEKKDFLHIATYFPLSLIAKSGEKEE